MYPHIICIILLLFLAASVKMLFLAMKCNRRYKHDGSTTDFILLPDAKESVKWR